MSRDKLIREKDVIGEMKRIGVDPVGIKLMINKSIFRIIRLKNIKSPLANIIKEDMLSAGGEAAVHKMVCACKVKTTDILIMGTLNQYKHLLERLKMQPYDGRDVAKRIKKLLSVRT